MTRNRTAAYHPRRIYHQELMPMITAVRGGAGHTVRIVHRERQRARQRSRLRQRRALITGGLGAAAAVGAVGLALAMLVARRRAALSDDLMRDHTGADPATEAPSGSREGARRAAAGAIADEHAPAGFGTSPLAASTASGPVSAPAGDGQRNPDAMGNPDGQHGREGKDTEGTREGKGSPPQPVGAGADRG